MTDSGVEGLLGLAAAAGADGEGGAARAAELAAQLGDLGALGLGGGADGVGGSAELRALKDKFRTQIEALEAKVAELSSSESGKTIAKLQGRCEATREAAIACSRRPSPSLAVPLLLSPSHRLSRLLSGARPCARLRSRCCRACRSTCTRPLSAPRVPSSASGLPLVCLWCMPPECSWMCAQPRNNCIKHIWSRAVIL